MISYDAIITTSYLQGHVYNVKNAMPCLQFHKHYAIFTI